MGDTASNKTMLEGGETADGAGALTVLVFSNGTSWTVVAK